jgi:hypothetical protein
MDAARPMLLLLGVLAGIGLVMGVVVLLISWRIGGTVTGGLKRTLQFVLSVVGVLQLVIQIGRAARPGLPPLLYRFYSALLLLQLEGITLHPNCLKPPPFQQDIAEMAIGLALMASLTSLFLNHQWLRACDRSSLGKHGSRRPLGPAALVTAAVTASARKNFAGTNAMQAREGGVLRDDGLVCWRRSGERLKPFVRGVVFSLLTLLYATVANTALRMLSCETQSMRVADYLQLRMDGTTLRSELGIGLSAVASPCLDAYCERRNPWFDRRVRVSVLSSNPGFVCYESPHFAVAVLAWACLALYTLGYPLFTFLLLRRRLTQLMDRGSLRQQYEMALLRDYTRRQAWAKAGGNACTRCWRRLCVRVCCLGSHFVSTAARHASPTRGLRACCASAFGPVTPLGGDVVAVVANPDVAAATEVFARLTARLSSDAATTSGKPIAGHQALYPLSRRRPPLKKDSQNTLGETDIAGTASGIVPELRVMTPAPTRSASARGAGAVCRVGFGASLTYARRKSGLLFSRRPSADEALAATTVTVASDGATRPLSATKLERPLSAMNRKLQSGAESSISQAASEGTSYTVGAPAFTADGEATDNSFLANATLRASRPGSSGGGRMAAAVVTANALLDGNPSITRNASLAHFTAANYRASCYWVRQQDMAVLLALGILAAFWPRSADNFWCGGLLALTAAVLCTEAGVLVAQKPFKPEAHWMTFVRLATILLSVSSALLNFVNATNPLPVAGVSGFESSSNGSSAQSRSERPRAVTSLSYLVFACSILLAVTLVVSFLLSLREGARREEVVAQQIVAFQRAVRNAPSAAAAFNLGAALLAPAATQPIESIRQRHLRTALDAAGGGAKGERVSFSAQAPRVGRPRVPPTRLPGHGLPRRPQPQHPEAR